jgi:hypothetical protein
LGNIEQGVASVCLGQDGGLAPPVTEARLYELSGEVTLAGASPGPSAYTDLPCAETPGYAFSVLDADGVTWTVGWTAATPSGEDLTANPPINLGDTVSVLVRATVSFGTAAGLRVDGADGLLVALEDGSWGPGLQAGDVPEVQVTKGEALGESKTDCGPINGTSLLFGGEEGLELDPVSSDSVELGGVSYKATALAAFEYAGTPTCTDVAGATRWVVTRE